MSAAVEPSYEAIAAVVVEFGAALAQVHERIAELEAQLGMNSRNSSKPPSADGLA